MRLIRQTEIGKNLIQLRRIVFDELPGWVVGTDAYFRLCRRSARVRERYEPLAPAPLSTHADYRNRKFVSRLTDLVIEGFPGSGNSFASNCVRAAITISANIESHYHYTAQLKRAVTLNVPAVVLVRDPAGACASMKSKVPHYWDWLIVLRWLRFNKHILRNRHCYDIVLFREFITDVDVIRRVSSAVRRLTAGPVINDMALQRKSATHHKIDESQPLVAWLMKRAWRVYEEIQSQLAVRERCEIAGSDRATRSEG